MSAGYRDDRGRAVALGEKLGEGGEGAVYRLADDARLAVKIYKRQMPADRVEKIQVLAGLQSPQLDGLIARPLSLVRDGAGTPRGLVLPAVDRGADIHNLYTPASRRRSFPAATWKFLIHVAMNVARAFAAVHQVGLVVGDVNPGSILVLNDGTVRLIDVDSFQVPRPAGRPLLCTVAVQMYLAPELHGAALDRLVRTADHDCFGLAVMLFQLLVLGRHPFAGRFLGRGDMPLERAVSEDRFAYGHRAAHLQMARPPNAVGLEVLSPEIAAMFEAAFAPRAIRGARPVAGQWLDALGRLQAGLVQCGGSSTHQHLASLRECPWCRFELEVGISLFGTPSASAPAAGRAAGIDGEYKRLSDVLATIPKPIHAKLPTGKHPATPNPLATRAMRVPWHGWVACAAGMVAAALGIAFAAVGDALLIPVGVLLALWAPGSRAIARQPWVASYRSATREHEQAVAAFKQANSYARSRAARAEAGKIGREWEHLPAWKNEKLRALEAQKRNVQLRRFLESQLIDRASIKGIGASRVASLSAFGMDTAWDVELYSVLQVPSFGTVLAERMVAWRRSREAAFVFKPNAPLPKEALAELDRELDARRRELVERLRGVLREVEAARQTEPAQVAEAGRRVVATEAMFLQASADVRAATGKVPT